MKIYIAKIFKFVSVVCLAAKLRALSNKLLNYFSISSIPSNDPLDEQKVRAALLAIAKKSLPSFVPKMAKTKPFIPVKNDAKRAVGYLALFFANLQEGEKVRMTFGHLPSLMLEDKTDFSQYLAFVKNQTSDFKIMCLDYRYSEILLDLREKFADGLKPDDKEVQAKLEEAKEISPNVSAISVKFMHSFIKEFGKDNFLINTSEKIAYIPRTWSFGNSGFRITTSNLELDLQKELHEADVNFGDYSAVKFNNAVFDYYLEKEYVK